MTADHTAHDVRYSYRPYIGWNSRSRYEYLYLFTVSNWSLLLMLEVCCWLIPVSFLAVRCFMA